VADDDAGYAVVGGEAVRAQERLAIGFGCSSRAASDEIVRLIRASVGETPAGTVLATIDRRAAMGEAVAAAFGLGLVLLSAGELAGVVGTTSSSSLALEKTGTANVAEAAALAALGAGARLVVPQQRGRFCTCAVAAVAEGAAR
jgi:cobalt-precorrin 5A hydrolase